MNILKEYNIAFSGLSLGNHSFEFDLDDRFFECFEGSEIAHGRFHVEMELEKKERLLNFNFHFEGTVRVACDRCAEEFDMPLEGDDHLLVKFGDETSEMDDDIMVLHHEETKLDVSGYIYDMISVMIPFRKIHPEKEDGTSGCDPDMLDRIESMQIPTQTDPRWDKLMGLLDNEN
ncbi:MAG: DUF177 domain-containing protein [Sphingobacteriia bacterium]|nr:DUF177 domain-containing protein [Sphingobacteriia bacterium]